MPNELQKILVELADKPLNINLGLGEKPINMNINIPGLKGVDGVDGRNGADGLSAYDIAQLEGFRGSRQEWLESLKAKVEVNNALTALKRKNIYLPNAQLDTVLTKLIELMGNSIDVPVKPLEFDQPANGQTYINVYGQPHFKVALSGQGVQSATVIEDSGKAKLNLTTPFASDDVDIEYFNLLDESIGTYKVRGNSGTKTTISDYEFANNYDTQNYEFPEVTTVGAYAFNSAAKTIKLPKAVRINKAAFDNCADVTEIYIPKFVMQKGNEFQTINLTELEKLVLNDESDVEALSKMALSSGKIYNQDETKYFVKASKSWVNV
ncbi:MAG: leucine-rich repeat protein [Veillonella sp.]|uniref:leucine-rich repeat protein n=1 Tax=Veillonella sp. TaxID=1926307 RepID=UPI001DF0787C|nr:leucine-rich repeat protein [Veillonella sp.]MBS6186125.1 leucine-rich repeat protein [Veillonella sp.]